MIDKRHVPLIVFVACVVLGLVLAVFTGAWPTALAIALAGCALGLAMRPAEMENHDTAFLEEDIADIRAVTGRQGEDIALLRTAIDEMAEIVESIATDMQRLSKAPGAREIAALRDAIDLTGRRVAALDAPRERMAARLDALDRAVGALGAGQAKEAMRDEPVALAATGTAPRMMGGNGGASGNGEASASVSLVDRSGPLRDRFPRARIPRKVRATPLFDPAGTPASLMIDDPAEQASTEGPVAVLRHALALVGASEDPDSRIFIRFSPDALADSALAGAFGPVLEEAGEAAARLVAVVHQASVKDGMPPALALLVEAGGRFGMERVADWSADLDALAARGLAVIAVDGPAMARSAVAQKGDPTRLRDVLHARGIQLLASEIATRMQLDAVGTLRPDLLAGPGLGEATLMEVPA